MRTLVASILLPFLIATSGDSLIRRHDVDDTALIEFGAQFPAVGKVGGMADGTLIEPSWVLTAAHVARATTRPGRSYFEVDGKRYAIEDVFLHPDFDRSPEHDLGLLRLREPVLGVEPLPLTKQRLTVGKVLVLVGHGQQGTGNRPERSEDGRRRAGTNRVDRLLPNVLVFAFEAPGDEQITDLEVTPGPGDSGGPALIETPEGYRVVAVSSSGSPGENGPGSYRADDHFARLEPSLDWIEQVLSGDREPDELSTNSPRGRVVRRQGDRAAGGELDLDALRDSPAGLQLTALLSALDNETVNLESFARDHFAQANDETLQRRAAALKKLRSSYGNAELIAILGRQPNQIDVLVVKEGTELILGVRVKDGLITGVFDGRP